MDQRFEAHLDRMHPSTSLCHDYGSPNLTAGSHGAIVHCTLVKEVPRLHVYSSSNFLQVCMHHCYTEECQNLSNDNRRTRM